MDLETLVVAFGADLTGLTSGVAGAKALIAGFGLGLAAVGVTAVKMAGDFQASMTSLVTGAGESQKNIGMVSAGILKMATETGTSTKQLADGMYMIESAGYHGADGLAVLKAAAEGAKVGNADLGVVANGVTTIMTDYADKNITAAQATNFLVATVASGKTHMQDLSAALSSILPSASSAKVSLNDVMGAMATMTGEGVPAADAATYLRQTLMTLSSPAKAGATALKEIGLSAQQVSDEMKKSLPETLKMIIDHLKNKFPEGSVAYQDALKAIAGGSKQMQGFLDLTGTHLQTFEGNVAGITGAVKKGGDGIAGWADIQKDFNFKIDQAKASVETFMITLGSKLLPILTPLIGNVATLVGSFTAWVSSGHAINDVFSLTGKYAQIAMPILAGLGAMVLAVLVPAFWSWAAGVIAATWPLLLIGAAVAGLVAIFVHFYQTNAGFKSFIDNMANGFKQAAGFIQANFMPAMQQVGAFLKAYVLPILQQIGSFVVSQFVPVWQNLVNLWNGQLMPLFKQLWDALQPLMPLFQLIGEVVGGIVVVAFVALVGVIQGVISAVATIISDIGSAIGGVVQIITGIVQVISGILKFIKDLFTANWSALGGDLKGIWQGIVNIFGGIFQTMGSIIHAIFGGIGSFISGFAQGVLNTIGNILGGADKMRIQAEQKQDEMKLHSINTALATASEVLKVEDKKRQDILKELENTKDPKKRHELEMQLSAITAKETEAKGVVDAEKKKKEQVLAHLADLKRQSDEANKSMVQKALDWFGSLKDGAVNKMGQLKDAIGGKMTDLRNWFGNFFSNFGKFWNDSWNGLGNILTGIWNNITGGIKGSINGVIDMINGIINGVNNISGKIGIPAIPDIPHLAAGTENFKGGMALVGENGPELVNLPRGSQVIPNNHLTSGSLRAVQGNQQAPVIHNHNHIYIDGREISDNVMVHVMSEMRSSGHPVGSAA